jgi:hypothetical protein
MRIFTDISSHDSSGVAPGGRIVRTDSTPGELESTSVNGQFVFSIPEGVAIEVDSNSFWFPQSDPNSISSLVASGMLVRYPNYDHVVYNFFLENSDVDSMDMSPGLSLPSVSNTTPVLPISDVAPAIPRCAIGRSVGPGSVGMVPGSLYILPRSTRRAAPVYGCAVTKMVDLWYYNPCYIDVGVSPVPPGQVVSIGGVSLTSVAGARTPGSDDFDGSLGTVALIAADMVSAINDPSNSFSTFVSAQLDPSVTGRVQLRPIPASNSGVTVSSISPSFVVVESHPGTDEIMLWWNVSVSQTSEDQGFSEQGPGAGLNLPAIKSRVEIDQELSALFVYVSVDSGASWFRANYLEPVSIGVGTELMVCFINRGGAGTNILLNGFCVLFPNMTPPV